MYEKGDIVKSKVEKLGGIYNMDKPLNIGDNVEVLSTRTTGGVVICICDKKCGYTLSEDELTLVSSKNKPVVYKLMACVKNYGSRRNSPVEVEFESVEYIYNNLDTALKHYEYLRNKCTCYTQYANRRGYCLLFIPDIFEDGTFANYPFPYPDCENQYIKEEKWGMGTAETPYDL